jgi:hypothetical protein
MLTEYFIPFSSHSSALPDKSILLGEISKFPELITEKLSEFPIARISKKTLETERESSSTFAKEIIAKAHDLYTQINNSLIDEKRSLNVRMFINKKLGQVTSEKQKIEKVSNGILQLFMLTREESKSIYLYSLQILANNLLKQSISQGYINAGSLKPLSIISCKVALKFKEFYPILLCTIFEASTYTIPKYINKKEGQSIKEYKTLLGYKIINDNLESDDSFFEKSCGIVALLASLINVSKEELGFPNPFEIEIGWRWIASICNLTPRLITPALISMFVDICGISLYYTYGETFKKLIEYIQKVFISMFPKQAQAYSARLNIVIENLSKDRK